MIDTNKRVGDNSICSKQKNQSVKQIHEGSRKVDTQCIDCHVDAKQQQHTDLPWTCRLCQQSNLALRILFILTLWLMLFPMAYGPPWERCISVYIYIHIYQSRVGTTCLNNGSMQNFHDVHLSCKIIVPDWFLKSHWLQCSVIWWLQIDKKTYHPSWSTLGFVQNTMIRRKP